MDNAEFLGMLVAALASLFALFKALAKPLVSGITELTKSITSLDMSVKGLKKDMTDIKSDLDKEITHSSESRRRLWAHNDEQDKRLEDHDKRIYHLEQKQ